MIAIKNLYGRNTDAMNSDESQSSSLNSQSGKEPDPWILGVESYTKEQPTKAVSAAFGAGLILALLPIGGILRLLFSALRPILVILGMVKVWEEVENRRQSSKVGEASKPQPE